MKWKRGQYQTSNAIYRPSDESAYELPENLIGTYEDPSLWAYSTLPPGDYDNLVSVHTIKQGKYRNRETIRQRMWLHDILDDEGIPYQVVIQSFWVSRKKYSLHQSIFVEDKNRKTAKRLIKAFMNADDVIPDFAEDDSTQDNYVDGVLQKKCPSCNKDVDFDYHKCPHCKKLF